MILPRVTLVAMHEGQPRPAPSEIYRPLTDGPFPPDNFVAMPPPKGRQQNSNDLFMTFTRHNNAPFVFQFDGNTCPFGYGYFDGNVRRDDGTMGKMVWNEAPEKIPLSVRKFIVKFDLTPARDPAHPQHEVCRNTYDMLLQYEQFQRDQILQLRERLPPKERNALNENTVHLFYRSVLAGSVEDPPTFVDSFGQERQNFITFTATFWAEPRTHPNEPVVFRNPVLRYYVENENGEKEIGSDVTPMEAFAAGRAGVYKIQGGKSHFAVGKVSGDLKVAGGYVSQVTEGSERNGLAGISL